MGPLTNERKGQLGFGGFFLFMLAGPASGTAVHIVISRHVCANEIPSVRPVALCPFGLPYTPQERLARRTVRAARPLVRAGR